MTSSRRASRRIASLGLAAAALILFAYARACWGEFLWDDDAHIYSNPTIVGPLGLKEIWTSGKANYFPLTMTSFWVQHALWGLAPAPYHFVTILFHVAGALVLWRVLERLRVPGAWLGAMLWALHPVQVESVAWICELKNTQSGFFYLLAIYFFLRSLPENDSPQLTRDYGFALLAAVAAILSKSSTVMLPVVLGVIGWWQGRRQLRDVRWLLPFFAVSLVASGWTIWEQKVNSMASGVDWDHGLAARFTVAGKVPWFYLGKLLWPQPLIFIYPRWDVAHLVLLDWIPLVATIAAAVWAWRAREGRGQPVFLAVAIFGVSLFPVLGLFDVFFFKYSFVGDHFQYLASMAPLALLGAAIEAWANRLAADKWIRTAAWVAPLAALGFLTFRQTKIYLTREALWRDTVELNPKAWIAQMNLGTEYLTAGRPDAAIPFFQRAFALRANDALAETNWGVALYQLGKPAEAIPHLENATRWMPDMPEARNALGLAYLGAGRAIDGIAEFDTAMRLRPGYDMALGNAVQSHLTVANGLLMAGKPEEAIPHYEAILKLDAKNLDARANLGTALYQVGRVPEAIPHYLAVAQARPSDAGARNNLASALLRSGQLPDAIAQYRAALQLQPDYLEARLNLAMALEAAGNKADAIREYEEILRQKPDQPGAREKLQRLRAP